MPYFTDTTNAPRIVTEVVGYKEAVSITTDTGMLGKTRTVSTTQVEHHGLTFAAADSIATTKNSETNTDASAFRMTAAGAYGVRVVVTTKSAWS